MVDRPGAVQTEIRVGNIGLPRKHKDFLALDIALKILGGEGGNRLHRVLRSERGLTYGAEADLHALKDTGDLVASTDTKSTTTAETLRLIVDEISKLQRQRVQQRELADAQAYLTGSFPLTIETPGAIALQVLNAVFYGLDLEELQNYRDRVNAITPEDIQRVAQQYLHPDRLSIVLVGDSSVFGKDLAGAGFDQIERIPLNELDFTAPDMRRKPAASGRIEPSYTPAAFVQTVPAARPQTPAKAAPAAPAKESDAAARELIAKAIGARGGLELLRSIKTVKATVDMVFATQTGPARVVATTHVKYPAQFRSDATGPDGRRVQTFDNGVAWVSDDSGSREAPPAYAKLLQATVQRDQLGLLLALHDNRVHGRRLPDVRFENTMMPVLEVELATAGRLTMLFDAATGLLAAQRYGGTPGDPATEETFLDYRPVQGMQVAHTVRVRVQGQPPFERTIRSIDFNVPVDPALFMKPKA